MVHLSTLQEMRLYRDEHLKEWVREHPGEFVLIEQTDIRVGFKVSFYESTRGLVNATRKYEGSYGPTFVSQRIPERYQKPWSLMNSMQQAREVHRETVKKLVMIEEFEKASERAIKKDKRQVRRGYA